jgi:hypothetical protein
MTKFFFFFLLVQNRVDRQLKMADRMRQREESSASTEPLPSAAASPSSASLSSPICKITTIEAFTEEDGDRVPYFPPNLKVFLEEPKSWDNLPKRSRLRFNHPLPDDDGCYHIESVIARAQVKIDGVFRLRFLVRWKGFEDVHNTWEPYAELEGTEALFRFENPGKALSCGAGLTDRGNRLGALALPVYGTGRFSLVLKGLFDVYIEKGRYQKIYGFVGYGDG